MSHPHPRHGLLFFVQGLEIQGEIEEAISISFTPPVTAAAAKWAQLLAKFNGKTDEEILGTFFYCYSAQLLILLF